MEKFELAKRKFAKLEICQAGNLPSWKFAKLEMTKWEGKLVPLATVYVLEICEFVNELNGVFKDIFKSSPLLLRPKNLSLGSQP